MDTIAIVSNGTSGLDVAGAAAFAGYDVVLLPLDEGPNAGELRTSVRDLGARRGLAAALAERALERMRIAPTLSAARECALVVDLSAIAEGEARGALLRDLELHMSRGAVLATDDPGFEQLARSLARPTQFVALVANGSPGSFEARATSDTAPGVAEAARLFCESLVRASVVPTAA